MNTSRGLQPGLGNRTVGRPPLLTRAEEDQVIVRIRECQRMGECMTFTGCTKWINDNLRPGDSPVGPKWIYKNDYILSNVKSIVPRPVEDLRIEACTYANFREFFQRLGNRYSAYNYDTRLIVNVDETTTHAGATHRSTLVLFDPNVPVRPPLVRFLL